MQRSRSKASNAAALALAAAAVVAGLCAQSVSAQLISLSDRKDHVFDPTRRILYVTTASGTVQRYDTVSNTFLTPFIVGGNLNGIDVTPDGNTLLVGDSTFSTATQTGQFRRFDATSGAVTTLTYPIGSNPSFTEAGSWDVVATSNGKAFFTTDFVGSAGVPLHEMNLSNNALTTRGGVEERTFLFRNASHGTMLMLQSNLSSGPMNAYAAGTDTFPASASMGFFPGESVNSRFHSDGAGAVSRDGQFFAVEAEPEDQVWIFDAGFTDVVQKLNNIEGGVIFDPFNDVLYGLDIDTDQVVFYDAVTFTEIKRMSAGGNLLETSRFGNGVTSFDPFESTLYVSTTGGILAISNVPEPGVLPPLAGLIASAARRRRRLPVPPASTVIC